MKKALIAGTFDPPTIGHEWLIVESLRLFDNVTVVISNNADKKTMFDIDQRKKLVEDVCWGYSVDVVVSPNRYLVDYAGKNNYTHIIRGIRSAADYEYEKQLKDISEDINIDVQFVYLLTPPHLNYISSSMVKGLVGYEHWESVVEDYLPENVYEEFVKFNKFLLTNRKQRV